MRGCLIAFCKNHKQRKFSNVQFFKITEHRYNSWMRAIRRDPAVEKISMENRICGEHFKPDDIIRKPGKRCKLRENAIPCLKLTARDNAENSTVEVQIKEELLSSLHVSSQACSEGIIELRPSNAISFLKLKEEEENLTVEVQIKEELHSPFHVSSQASSEGIIELRPSNAISFLKLKEEEENLTVEVQIKEELHSPLHVSSQGSSEGIIELGPSNTIPFLKLKEDENLTVELQIKEELLSPLHVSPQASSEDIIEHKYIIDQCIEQQSF